MGSPRLKMALKQLGPSDWKRFEEFASAFIAREYPNLRTLAGFSGDEGRDAELFSPSGLPSVALQYSVTQDWRSKIRNTAQRISDKHSEISILIYVTNQLIGASADSLKAEILKQNKIYLDIRDQNYFLDRFYSDHHLEDVAEDLAKDVVDPFLSSNQVIERRATALTNIEMQAAFVHLGLQWRDDIRDKGLTKLSFEALVRTVLRDTDSEKKMHREEIKKRVRQLLPNHPPEMVDVYTTTALKRLTKNAIKHWEKQDEFHLSHEEKIRLREYLADLEVAEEALRKEIQYVFTYICSTVDVELSLCEELSNRLRRILERFLFNRSEAFATAVYSQHLRQLKSDDLDDVIIRDLSDNPARRDIAALLPDVLSRGVRAILTNQSEPIQQYLRSLADSYTLMAFLRQTPDVQSAVEKIFSFGEIWLDTSIILHLLAETLLEEQEGRFQKMIRAAKEEHVKFLVEIV